MICCPVMSQYSVLVAEAERAQQQIIEMLLSLRDCDVVESADAREALEYLRHNTPHLVIAAADLPQMSGLDISRKLRSVRRLKSVPVIITGPADTNTEEARSAATAAGADLYLTRPLGDKNLAARALALIETPRSAPAPAAPLATPPRPAAAAAAPASLPAASAGAGQVSVPILEAVTALEARVAELEEENRQLTEQLRQERRVGRNTNPGLDDVGELRRRLNEAERKLAALKKDRAEGEETNPLKMPIGQLVRRH